MKKKTLFSINVHSRLRIPNLELINIQAMKMTNGNPTCISLRLAACRNVANSFEFFFE